MPEMPGTEEFGFLGTLPQWGMFITMIAVLLLVVFKLLPVFGTQSLMSKQQDIEGWRDECHKLREELKQCQEQCERETRVLHEEIFGQRKQHLADQIALINVIIHSVDAPELQTLLKTLEAVNSSLRLTQIIANERKED